VNQAQIGMIGGTGIGDILLAEMGGDILHVDTPFGLPSRSADRGDVERRSSRVPGAARRGAPVRPFPGRSIGVLRHPRRLGAGLRGTWAVKLRLHTGWLRMISVKSPGACPALPGSGTGAAGGSPDGSGPCTAGPGPATGWLGSSTGDSGVSTPGPEVSTDEPGTA
jgi:hypothetical protein